jgi:hypothetical protein
MVFSFVGNFTCQLSYLDFICSFFVSRKESNIVIGNAKEMNILYEFFYSLKNPTFAP